ncbi:hypothetical protein NliqN6_6689 [Naganishia liquefaciens]|uniref:Beta-glucuronidase C-terminal domain-containing protein n=1 Tax=Naganishia liquefaciens TaxID=104408 RepID=A0A8H3U065_9TREE|nr:hypothetical protein NliqN6_6689 [Naganishia liquefaciens]
MTPNSIYLPLAPPSYAQPLSHELLGLSIEGDRFEDWTGPLGHANAYTHQALRNSQRGQALLVRSADSQDKYRLTQDVRTALVALAHPPSERTPYPEPAMNGVQIGPDYFALAQNLPEKTKLTIGLNLRSQDEKETLAQAALLVSYAHVKPFSRSVTDAKYLYSVTFHGSRKEEMKNVELELVTIGNEASNPLQYKGSYQHSFLPLQPDLYEVPSFHRVGPPSWSPFAYVAQTARLAPLVSRVLQDDVKFQIGNITGFFKDREEWVPRTILGTGLMQEQVFKKMTVYSSHMYLGDLKAASGSLMNKTFIRQMIRHWSEYRPIIEAAGLEFRIGETNSLARGGVPGISNAAEAAIWLVDYALHAATLGIKRLHFHHRIGQSYNWFDPIPITGISGGTAADAHDAPSIHAPYYGALVVAEAIGSTSTDTMIVELASIIPHISAFGIYESGQLSRAVFVDSEVYVDPNTPRWRTRVELRGMATKAMRLRRLYAPMTTSTSGLAWAGQSYETADFVATGALVEDKLKGNLLEIAASEVVLVLL